MPVDRENVMAQIDTRFEEYYRIGWPKNSLLSWPVASSEISHDDSNDISGWNYGEVKKLIYQAGYSARVYYAFRQHDITRLESLSRTLVVEPRAIPADIKEWKYLLIDIRDYLRAKGNHCTIEILYGHKLYLQPIHFEEKTVLEAWKTQSLLFLDILRDENFTSLELYWMSVLSPKIDRATTKPRVLIFSPSVDTPQWEAVRTELQTRLLPVFDLEFIYSKPIQRSVGYNRNQGNVFQYPYDRYNKTVKMGASIRVQGCSGEGTAGAKLTLSGSTGDEDFVITNNHVVECEETKATMNLDRISPITPNHPLVVQRKIQFVSPADAAWSSQYNKHRKALIQSANSLGPRIGCSNRRLLELEGEIERQENAAAQENKDGSILTNLKKELHQMESEYAELVAITAKDYEDSGDNIDELFGKGITMKIQTFQNIQQDLDIITQHETPGKRHLGYLWASSAYRMSRYSLENSPNGPGWLLDWAIGKLDLQKRDISKIVPYVEDDNIDPPIKISVASAAERYQSPREKQEIAKHGRMSGWTTGYKNAAEVFIKLDSMEGADEKYEPLKPTVSGPIVGKYGSVCRAYSFSNDGKEVMRPGDSGSIVLANEDSGENVTWLGLAFAGSMDRTRGFMTPMDVVLHDIEQVTGHRVTMPRRE
jgi:hypothetical protein